MAQQCSHMQGLPSVRPGSSSGCKECIAMGDVWVHLRMCMSCGHIGCCDSSKNRHATAHYKKTQHPCIKSFEPGENWSYCYIDKLFTE